MQISKEEFQRRMNFYTSCIPHLDWFSSEEQEKLVLEADQNARIYQVNFLPILENLTFMRSFTKVIKPIII
jgi:hypothetical protein